MKTYVIRIRRSVVTEHEYEIEAERPLEAQQKAKELTADCVILRRYDVNNPNMKLEIISTTVDGKTHTYE